MNFNYVYLDGSKKHNFLGQNVWKYNIPYITSPTKHECIMLTDDYLIGISYAAIKSFFFMFPYNKSNDPFGEFPEQDADLERWLNDDEISDVELNNPRNKQYLKELKQLKDDFRSVYYGRIVNVSKENKYMTVYNLLSLILVNKVQIARLRFAISPETFINIHEHPNTGYRYSVMRSYWISDNLKKIKKYSFNIGNLDKLNKTEYEQKVSEGYATLKKQMQEAYNSHYKK